MKIAFLSFYSGHIDRGVEVATAALAKGLNQKHTVSVFQAGARIDPEVPTHVIAVEQKWPVDSSSSLLRLFYLDYYSRKILQFSLEFIPFFFREKYDVVIPTNGGWQIVICRFLCILFRKKMIVQGNAGIGRDDFWQLLSLPDKFIAISPAGLRWARQKAPWVSSTYIPYGVHLMGFDEIASAEMSLKPPIVLCVAAFSPYKQIELVIKAVAKTKNLSLLVIGHGPLEKKLRALGEELLNKRFLLRTDITHDQLYRYYKACQVFSLPSQKSEAFGIVYIEAMAAGLPIVAPDDENRRVIIGDAGNFVNVHNEDEYAKALEKAVVDDFSASAKIQAAQFSWDRIISQYEKILERL